MIGCDTNVLIRAALEDDPNEAKIARQFLEKTSNAKKLFISSYAILEMAWVMKVKKRTRHEIVESILDLLDSPGIVVAQREAIESALELYKKGKADFADYLILSEGELHHVQKLASFDKVLCKDNHRVKNPKKYN